MATSPGALAGAVLLATLSCATAKEGPFYPHDVTLDGQECVAFQGEMWALNCDGVLP